MLYQSLRVRIGLRAGDAGSAGNENPFLVDPLFGLANIPHPLRGPPGHAPPAGPRAARSSSGLPLGVALLGVVQGRRTAGASPKGRQRRISPSAGPPSPPPA